MSCLCNSCSSKITYHKTSRRRLLPKVGMFIARAILQREESVGPSSGLARKWPAWQPKARHPMPRTTKFAHRRKAPPGLPANLSRRLDEATLTTTHRHIAIPVGLPIPPAPAHFGTLRFLLAETEPRTPSPARRNPRFRTTPRHQQTEIPRTTILTILCSNHG